MSTTQNTASQLQEATAQLNSQVLPHIVTLETAWQSDDPEGNLRLLAEFNRATARHYREFNRSCKRIRAQV